MCSWFPFKVSWFFARNEQKLLIRLLLFELKHFSFIVHQKVKLHNYWEAWKDFFKARLQITRIETASVHKAIASDRRDLFGKCFTYFVFFKIPNWIDVVDEEGVGRSGVTSRPKNGDLSFDQFQITHYFITERSSGSPVFSCDSHPHLPKRSISNEPRKLSAN